MIKIAAINANPREDQGHAGVILSPSIKGLKEKGAAVDLFFASKL